MALPPELLAAARRYGPSVDSIAEQYGLSGAALLAKLVQGESGGRHDAVSSAGARAEAQFMPSSRKIAMDKYGVDPWADVDQAVHGAALHLRGKINGSTGLKGYNPGSPTYTDYILGQKVGNVSAGSVRSSPQPATSPAAPSGQPAAALIPQIDPGQGTDASALIALLGRREQPRVQSSTPLAAPAATAAPAMPAGFRALSSGGGPAPKGPDVSELLSLVRTQGGGAAPAPAQADAAAASPGAPAASLPASAPKGRVFPTGGVGKVIGTPYAGTHTLGNWQSDNAVDIGAPVGTPMLALQDGVVVKVTKHPQGSGRFAGDQITIRGANGNEYFYAHGAASVKAGQKIKRGQSLGTTGSANGVAHLHFGQMKGDPRKHTK